MKKLVMLFMFLPSLLLAHPYNYPHHRRPGLDRLRKLFDSYVSDTTAPAPLPVHLPEPESVIPGPIKINLLQLDLYRLSSFKLSIYDEYDVCSGRHLEYGVQFTFKR